MKLREFRLPAWGQKTVCGTAWPEIQFKWVQFSLHSTMLLPFKQAAHTETKLPSKITVYALQGEKCLVSACPISRTHLIPEWREGQREQTAKGVTVKERERRREFTCRVSQVFSTGMCIFHIFSVLCVGQLTSLKPYLIQKADFEIMPILIIMRVVTCVCF